MTIISKVNVEKFTVELRAEKYTREHLPGRYVRWFDSEGNKCSIAMSDLLEERFNRVINENNKQGE